MARRIDRRHVLCPRCRGRGRVDRRVGKLAGATVRVTCPRCAGLGLMPRD